LEKTEEEVLTRRKVTIKRGNFSTKKKKSLEKCSLAQVKAEWEKKRKMRAAAVERGDGG